MKYFNHPNPHPNDSTTITPSSNVIDMVGIQFDAAVGAVGNPNGPPTKKDLRDKLTSNSSSCSSHSGDKLKGLATHTRIIDPHSFARLNSS